MKKIRSDGRRTGLCLALLTLWYLGATLPHLGDFPRLDWPQMGIVAPAHKLATEGVYGNDLFAGFHRSELRNYEYMPAYPLLVALSFKILGAGVIEARLVSVLCGWLVVLLTFHLGRQLYGAAVGLVAAGLLCVLRLGLLTETTGVPLLDFARVIRYDILVPVGVLAAASCFVWASSGEGKGGSRSEQRRGLAFLAGGLLAGLATLGHVYGAFILPVFVLALLWHRGRHALLEAPVYLLTAGWLIALLPWVLYVLQDLDASLGQMSRHQGRFDLLDPGFYWRNLRREIWRYAPWLKGGFPATFLQPRAGIWLLLIGVPAGLALVGQRVRRTGRLADRFLLLSLPLLALCLALLMFMKRYFYTLLVLPFLALLLGLVLVEAWRRGADRRIWRAALVVLGVLVVAEGAVGVRRALAAARQSSPYLELCRRVGQAIPAGARLLISQPYWLGLAQLDGFELRSVQMVHLLAKSMPVDGAMARLAPDYVVIESHFLEPRSGPGPGPEPGSEAERVFLELAGYLERACDGPIAEVSDADYGIIEVYRCQRVITVGD